MENASVYIKKEIDLKNPVLIEGLPGLGLVGKLGAEHLIEELKAQKFAELYSTDFPPQVMILDDSTIRMRRNEFFYWEAEKSNQKDIIIVVGDDQGLTIQAQYNVCDAILNTAENYGTKMLYTLGGYGIQKLSKTPRVFGAVTHKDMIKQFKEHGVIFQKVPGAIVGAAGLLLGLGQLRGIKGICLMGETHGNYIDARAAKNVIKVVADSLNLDISYSGLDKKAKETRDDAEGPVAAWSSARVRARGAWKG
jgi:uncharacterized protein (TIGR00162 family)